MHVRLILQINTNTYTWTLKIKVISLAPYYNDTWLPDN